MNSRVKRNRLAFVANPNPQDLAETVRVPWTQDYVTIINICRLMEALYGPNVWCGTVCWEERSQAMRDWCERHDVGYYAAPREDFGMMGAWRAARDQGKAMVVVEDMS